MSRYRLRIIIILQAYIKNKFYPSHAKHIVTLLHIIKVSTIRNRAIRKVNNVGYHEHTNILYFKLHTLKFKDLVQFKTTQKIYEAKIKQLPGNIQQLFTDREVGFKFETTECLDKAQKYVYFNLWDAFVE